MPFNVSLHNMSSKQVLKQMQYVRGRVATGSRTFVHVKKTPTPTVQGFWHPDLELAATQTAFEALDLNVMESRQRALAAAAAEAVAAAPTQSSFEALDAAARQQTSASTTPDATAPSPVTKL